jgi:hypothetical protein
MASREDLIEVFEGTENWCKHDEKLTEMEDCP